MRRAWALRQIASRPLSDFVAGGEWSELPLPRSDDARHWHVENGEWHEVALVLDDELMSFSDGEP